MILKKFPFKFNQVQGNIYSYEKALKSREIKAFLLFLVERTV